MNPDDPVCLCFHVTRRKVVNFIRVEKPRRPSQLSQCFGAGTGCGWCRPFLERLLAEELKTNRGQSAESAESAESAVSSPGPLKTEPQESLDQISYQQYAQARAKYVKDGGGKPPPGAIPIEGEKPPKSRDYGR
jgi:bacterioferritin-associated ferredoxin